MSSLVIPLSATPNQSLSCRLGDSRFVLTIKEVMGMMVVTVERDSVVIVNNWRAVAGAPIIPFEYLEAGTGNLIFTCAENDTIPYWSDFGVTCFLVWTSQDELEVLRHAG